VASPLDIDAIVAAMEKFHVSEAVMDVVTAAVDARPAMTLSDVGDLLKANGVSQTNVSRIKNAVSSSLTPTTAASASDVLQSSASAHITTSGSSSASAPSVSCCAVYNFMLVYKFDRFTLNFTCDCMVAHRS
jgi:hypothetical protein